jgi:hypothetical protein
MNSPTNSKPGSQQLRDWYAKEVEQGGKELTEDGTVAEVEMLVQSAHTFDHLAKALKELKS